MHSTAEKLRSEVELFRLWAATVPVKEQAMEWQCDYAAWSRVYQVTAEFLAEVEMEALSAEMVHELLYIVAADHSCQIIAHEVARYPEKLLYLAQAAVGRPYANAKWQLAIELGNLHVHKATAERILVALTQDEDEYTRRRALGALAEAGSPLVSELVKPAWDSNHLYQRIMVLSALYKVASPELEKYLALADLDGQEYLVAWATRIRCGQVD